MTTILPSYILCMTGCLSCYSFSKVTVEKRALEFASAPHCSFRVATILPGLLLGPHLGNPTIGTHFYVRFLFLVCLLICFFSVTHFIVIVYVVPGCNAFGYKFLIRFINSYRGNASQKDCQIHNSASYQEYIFIFCKSIPISAISYRM